MIIQLLKLVEFGKEGDSEKRSSKVLLYHVCPETNALRGDMIMAIHSDFKAGRGTYHYCTFFICIKQLPSWSVFSVVSTTCFR